MPYSETDAILTGDEDAVGEEIRAQFVIQEERFYDLLATLSGYGNEAASSG